MEHRALGQSGLSIAPLVFGGNVFGWTADEKSTFALLDAFVDAGLNMIDTADMYSRWVSGNRGGESETLIGKWLKASGKRDRVLIATKVGMDMGEGRKGLKPARIRQAVEESLSRLQIDTIDLYQSHTDDIEVPMADTLGAYAALIQAGKIRAIGASNFSAARLAEARELADKHGLPRYESLQPAYNLMDRQAYERDLQPEVKRQGLGVISYYGLARGFLSGKYRSAADAGKSPRGKSITGYLDDRGLRVLTTLDDIAGSRGVTPAAISLAWILGKSSITAPIVSATSVAQLTELLAATRIHLHHDEMSRLDQASRLIG